MMRSATSTSCTHSANGGSWTRTYEYNEASLLEPAKKSNRLTKTTVGNGAITRNLHYTTLTATMSDGRIPPSTA